VIDMEELRVSPPAVKAVMDRGEPLVFLDVRSPEAWDSSGNQIPGAIRLPLTDFEAHADELPREGEIIAYCT
jgi:rhodanese-related sulfurtransferase